MERLDKLIASQGKYSRKEVKALIARRRVTVDGVTAKAPEQKVDADKSTIAIDGTPFTVKKQLYLMLNKPRGYVSSTDDSDGVSVLELVHAFEKVNGLKIPYEITDRRPGDIAICYADASKAERELGWVAENGILEMCADSWNWQSHNPNGFED